MQYGRIATMAHEHLRQAGILEHAPISFELSSFSGEQLIDTHETDVVEHFAGGGFHGSVIILPEKVIKTTAPADALHELLRNMNWPTPFPSQANKYAALEHYISGRIIHSILPYVTDNRVTNPDAYGVTDIEGLGYGQLRERVYGRGPTFKDKGKENAFIAQTRNQLWNLGVAMGMEHFAQVHPKNPFGKPNIWIGKDGNAILLDDLPAIRHTGYVKPFFFYREFHSDVRRAFRSEAPTFNTIHTNTLRTFIATYPDIPETVRDELYTYVDLYEEIHPQVESWARRDPRLLYIEDAVQRKLITPEQGYQLTHSELAYRWYNTTETARLGLRTFTDIINKTPAKILWNRESQKNVWKFITNPHYRHEQALEHTMLWGITKAHENGLMTDEEFDQALSFVPDHELELYEGLQVAYLLTSRLTDLATPIVAAAFAADPLKGAAVAGAFNFFGPGIIRAVATEFTAIRYKKNLHRMAAISAIPLAGAYTAVPVDLYLRYGQQAEELFHDTLRGIVSLISKVRPGGGWGSDAEEKIWNTLLHYPKPETPEQPTE